MRTAAATHSHSTARNARSTGPGSGPRQTASPTRTAVGTSTRTSRPARLRGTRGSHAAALTASAGAATRS